MANPSLSEYVAQSQRGLYNSVFGPDFMSKAGALPGTNYTVDTANSSGIFNTTYGRKVWQALNNQTRFFNAIPRTVWGNTAGWRVRSARATATGASRSGAITETGELPSIDISDVQTISSLPRIIGTTFGASVKSVFTAQLEGGVGDVLALENENAQLDHIKEINEQLLAMAAVSPTSGTTTTFTSPGGKYFKAGDTLRMWDANLNAWDTTDRVIDSVNRSTGVVTFTAADGSIAAADGDVFAVKSRAGVTSIDDIVWTDGTLVGGVTTHTNYTDDSGVGVYDITLGSRVAGGWNAAAHIDSANGAGRALDLAYIDNCIQKIRENGGEPKLILMGHDQYFAMERILHDKQRYMGQEEYQVGVGSERTFPGTKTGMVLATYMGIPILPDADVSRSVGSDNALDGSQIYVLDTDYIEMAVAQPTQYVENRDYFAANSLVVRGLLYTMGEMRCRNLWVQGKIMDLAPTT